jgi:protease-4
LQEHFTNVNLALQVKKINYMKGFFKYVFAGMVGTILALIVVIVIGIITIVGIVSSSTENEVKVEKSSILHIKFDDAMSDRGSVKPDFSDFSMKKTIGIIDITQDIYKASKDENIKGIYLELTTLNAGIATVEEIRNALLKFKESKKFIIAHSDYFTHKTFYLASVADKIYLTPEGEVQFVGLSANILMFKTMLEKVGIEPEIIRHGKFKSAVEPFMLTEISDENREQTLKYIGSIWNSMLQGISKQRNISIENLNKYADELSVNSAQKALELKLVDGLKYKDEVYSELRQLTNKKEKDKLEFISLSEYNTAPNRPKIEEISVTSKDKIAIIYAIGDIGMGSGDENTIGSDKLSEAIRKARKDSSVKAIVLRINSPGGSALASEVIWRETVLAKKDKPFIVSMGDVAASGGYYIACFADTIVAQPNTITGSIGVFGLLFNAKDLMKNVGISVSVVNTNKYSDMANPSRKMTDYERGVIQISVEEIYATFIKHVAEGRKMSVEKVDEIGQGRVWSGADAKEIGLIDVYGGLGDAIKIAAQMAKLDKYKLVSFPEKDKYQEMFEDLLSETRMSVMEKELGSSYYYFDNFKKLSQIQGIQARIPFFIELN